MVGCWPTESMGVELALASETRDIKESMKKKLILWKRRSWIAALFIKDLQGEIYIELGFNFPYLGANPRARVRPGGLRNTPPTPMSPASFMLSRWSGSAPEIGVKHVGGEWGLRTHCVKHPISKPSIRWALRGPVSQLAHQLTRLPTVNRKHLIFPRRTTRSSFNNLK